MMNWMHKGTAAFALIAAPMAQAQDNVAPSQADAANLAAIERHIEAYRSGDIDRFVATFAHDAQVFANGLEARGHDEIRAIYALNFVKDAPKIRIEKTEAANGMVFLEVSYIFATGEELCCSFSEYEVVDGKIAYLAASG